MPAAYVPRGAGLLAGGGDVINFVEYWQWLAIGVGGPEGLALQRMENQRHPGPRPASSQLP